MKTRTLLKSIAFITISIFSISVHAQISTNELPPSFSTTLFSVRSSDVIELPIPNVAEALHEDSLFADAGIPYRVGLPIAVNYNLQNSGVWQTVGDSMRVWRLQLRAPDAKALTVSYDKFWIPEGAKLFVYNIDKDFCIGAFTSINNKGTRENPVDFASGFVAGDNIVLEYYEPIGSMSGIISIQSVVYVYKNVLVAQSNVTRGVTPGISLSCNVNINCPEGADWQKEKRAVAAIYDSKGALCTGALINNTQSKDYFLSANHCFTGYDAQGNNQMNQLIFYWNYESPDCSNTYIYNPPSSAGAKLLANSADTDFALLEMTEKVKDINGYIPYYLGWTRTSTAASWAVGIHHPQGDIKKISKDNNPVTNYASTISWAGGTITPPNTHWKVVFDVGTAEGGSSGSPLLNPDHKVIGQLHGGDSGCAPITKFYGRFDKSWDYGNVATRRLKDWLDPGNTGITQMETQDIQIIGDDIICDSSIYYIEGLPANMNVIWEYPGKGAPQPIMQMDYPMKNQCIIRNLYKYPLVAELKANVTYNGTVLATLKKQVVGDSDRSNVVKGTYTQETCTFYNVVHPAISGTLISGQSTFVHQGCMVHVKLNEAGKDVRIMKNSSQPTYWYYDKVAKQLDFQLPYGSGGIPYTFTIGGNGACYEKYMVFFSVSNNGNVSNYSVEVGAQNSCKEVTIIPDKRLKSQIISKWNLEVYDTVIGRKMIDVKDINATSYSIETSGWAPGEYVVRAIIGEEVATEIITIEK